jgi:hypothetical protein
VTGTSSSPEWKYTVTVVVAGFDGVALGWVGVEG